VYFVDLKAAFYRPELAAGSMSKDELALKAKRLLSRGAIIRHTTEINEDTVRQMVSIHTRRWELKGEEGNFGDPRRVAFVRLLTESAFPILFSTMWIDAELIAYRFGPYDRLTYYDWNTGFAPVFKRFSPGSVLLASVFDHLRGMRISRLDFLRGDETYKLAWATGGSRVLELGVMP
jgi:CelD/BcsL family acetyltransferase involved in cellulose biosynthesis